MIRVVMASMLIGAGAIAVQQTAFASRRPDINHSSPRPDRPKPMDPTLADGIATFSRTATLKQVSDACTATANNTRHGAVVLTKGLRDRKVNVTFTVPCAVQLPKTATFEVDQVKVTSKTLNLADGAFGAGTNRVSITGSRFTGDGGSGLLIQLTDFRDRIEVKGSTLTYPLGINLVASGDRVLPDSGGSILADHTAFAAKGPDGDGVTIMASTERGEILVRDPVFAGDAVAVVSDRCTLRTGGRSVSCSASSYAKDLRKQAKTARR